MEDNGKKTNIILIGMPGAGKSTVGVLLAKDLGMNYIDADLVIQSRTGKRLKKLIQEHGLNGFICLENQINQEIQAEHTVIATGGSAVFGEAAMKHFQSNGIIVYLEASFEDLKTRLGSLAERGVIAKEGQTLKDIYEERTPLYEKYADIVIRENSVEREGIDPIRVTKDAVLSAVRKEGGFVK